MATLALIPVEQYLRTNYDPDCDFVDGEVLERNMGEGPHALMQGMLYAIFFANRRKWSVLPLPEQRILTSATHFRVADFCLVAAGKPLEGIVRIPPLLCVEVISSGQTLRDMQARTGDYLGMGVRQVWVVDPLHRRCFVPNQNGVLQPTSGEMTVPETEIAVSIEALFAEYDELAAGN